MKFTCSKDTFLRAVSTTGRLATNRATLPILQNISLTSEKQQVRLRATDLEQTIEVSIAAEIKEPGAITIPARLLIEYLQNNTDKEISFSTDDTNIELKSANHSAKIKGAPAEDYPTLPEIEALVTVSLESKLIHEAITQTLFAAANDDTRPILNGLLFRFQTGRISVVATDGYRLASYQSPISAKVTGDYILPKRSLQELQRLLDDSGELELSISQTQVRFQINDTVLISRVLEGNFPSYETIIPKSAKLTVKVGVTVLLQSLKIASLFSRDSAYSTKLELIGKKLRIIAVSAQIGENVNEIELEKEVDEKFTISLNAQYAIDLLSTVSGDVEIGFIDNKSPIVFRLPELPEYIYLLMPLRSE